MDMLRNQMLSGDEGLPLGILASKQQFTDVEYILSSEFRFGLAGFARRRKRLLFGVFILTSTLISLFAGPSAALLLIPTQRSNWPAGGASFWLAGDDEDLWPSKLTALSVGGPDCESPQIQTLSTEALNSSGCIWAGYSSLVEAFKQRHYGSGIELVVDDGVLKREYVIRSRGEVAETWVLAIHMAVGVLAENVAQAWYDALKGISLSSWHHTLRYRIFNGTIGSVQSWIPAVRTDCTITDLLFDSPSLSLEVCSLNVSSKMQTLKSKKYPDVPEYGVRLDLGYWIETNLSTSPNISTQWITVPETAQLSDNSYTTDVPSAFLDVQMPYTGPNNTGTTVTCSVDARWAMGTYSGGPVGDVDADYVQTATIQNTRPFSDLNGFQYNFLPIDDGTWRRVQIDTDWLNTLTPSFDSNTPGWTSLAALLTDIGIDDITDSNQLDEVLPVLETIVAILVADGMSRQGYAANGGSSTNLTDALNQIPWDNSVSSQQSLLAGTYAFPPPAGPSTPLRWTVVVAGYAYRADSLAYYLALTVLFLHAALALGHIAYVLRTRVCCDAWDSFVGLVVLAAKSSVPAASSGAANVFKNTSAGIERYRTMGTHVRIRALSSTPTVGAAAQEEIEIIFGDKRLEAGYRTVEIDKSYG